MITVEKNVPPHFQVFPREMLPWKVIKLWGQNNVSFIPTGASPSRDNTEGVDGFILLRNVAYSYTSITSNVFFSKQISY